MRDISADLRPAESDQVVWALEAKVSRNLSVVKHMTYKTLTALSLNAENRVDAPGSDHRTRPNSSNSHKR